MEAVNAPHRRDFARMYTSFLKLPGAIEAQLVKYDQAEGSVSRSG